MSRTVLFSATPAPPPAPLPAEPVRVVHVHGPSASTWVAVALGLILAVGGGYVLRPGHAPTPNPTPVPGPSAPYDPAFVPLGRAYGSGPLAERYADAWDDGAKLLDAGQKPPAALDTVAKAWEAGRVALYDQAMTPQFSRIVPESKKEADITPDECAALAKAWRGFAHGLRGAKK